ncbi:TonB-dependent receptor [Paucibacter sp. R3-3]|uniref:TonB-dependent receptor n=1 Tax=Roseateles agri TaxID=3098619 RepID=A0ABU5DRR7_9BURK|nr:TonB-dependent receptor [Paucibacter sp. R3-3]MDY0749021.1 TonB-dependent receptor [Paucibacter sp. R3-3]
MTLASTATPAAHAEADSDIVTLQTVTVTARKRSEDLQDIPISIIAYSQDELRARSVQRLSDLGQLTPNFLYGQKIQSGSSAGQVYIRGIGQQDTNVAFSPGVGIYVDGVYLGRAQANDADLPDLERVEVLFGPQGTLFGKNTNGGVVNIVTKRPDASAAGPSGTAELQAGDFRRRDASVYLNVPLQTNTAALGLSAATYHADGYSKRADGEDQADRNRGAIRLQLLLTPDDDVEALVRVDRTSFNEHSAAYKLIQVRTSSPIPMLYAAQTPYRYDDRWVTASDYTYDGAGPNRNAGSVWGSSLTVQWNRPWGTLKSISAYRHLSVDSQFDPDGSPLSVLDVFNTVQQHQISQELQATGSSMAGKLDWVAGLYYFKESAQDDQPAIVAAELFNGAANFNPQLHVVNQNYAIYGQANFRASSALTLTAGLRAGVDNTQAGLLQVGFPTPVVQTPFVERSAQWSSLLPRLSASYQWSLGLMTFASVAEGSKTGGFNGRAASANEFTRFEPERVWSYEAGIRSDWADKRLRVNATVFYNSYLDFQLQLNRSVTDPNTGKPVAFSFVGNIPKARVQGGEFSVELLPFTRLRLMAGLGITDGKYLQVLPGAPVTTASDFVNAPRYTFTSSAEYSTEAGAMGYLTARIDYVHKSRIEYDYSNSPLVAQAPYGLLNARLTWHPADKRFSLFAFGTNLTGTHYATGGIDDGAGGSLGEVVKLMGAPREWGLGASYRF